MPEVTVTPSASNPSAPIQSSPGLAARDARRAAAKGAAVESLKKATGKTDPTEQRDAGLVPDDTEAADPPARAEGAVEGEAQSPAAKARAEAERRFREKAADLKRTRAEREQRSKAEAESARREAEREATWKQREADIRRADLAKTDPFTYLESLGVTATQLMERGIKRGSPEALAEAKIANLEAELTSFKQWKETFLEESKEQAARQQTEHATRENARINAEKRAEVANILKTATREQLPTLINLPTRYVTTRAFEEAGNFFRETGEHPDMFAVLKMLDAEIKKENDVDLGSRQGAVRDSATQVAPLAKAAGRPKTLTPGRTTTPPKPANHRDDRKAAAVAQLRRARTK